MLQAWSAITRTPVIVSSLASALRLKSCPVVLDLEASEDLKCKNLLCEKVGGPCICRLARVLEGLEDVVELRLAGNQLTALPAAVWELNTLKLLDLSHNCLVELPRSVFNLHRLEELNLDGNANLQQLPADVYKMRSLKKLDLPHHLR